jgi:serine/threonine protein kinase
MTHWLQCCASPLQQHRAGAGSVDTGRMQPCLDSWMHCFGAGAVQVLQQRDPVRRGLPSRLALRLLLRLLHWNPAARPSAADALRHAFFVVPLDAQHNYTCPADQRPADGGGADGPPLEGWC